MLRTIPRSTVFAIAVAFAAAPTAASAQTVTATPGFILGIETINEEAFGNTMYGMSVTAHFDNGEVRTGAWGALGAGQAGVKFEDYLNLTLGQTQNTFDGYWSMESFTQSRLTRLVFGGAPGGTVFDRTLGGAIGTPGSSLGRDYDTGLIADFLLGTTATYTNAVRLGEGWPVGDLYETVDIDFSNSVLAFNQGDFLTFRMDTDNALYSTVPEPATVSLTAAGLIGLAAVARRRRRTA